jgi:hypothetical protein
MHQIDLIKRFFIARLEYPIIAELIFNKLKPEMFFQKSAIHINLNSKNKVKELV